MECPVEIQEVPNKFPGHCSMMVYGPAGTGKTEFGASTGAKGIVLSIGDGELTLSSPGFRKRNPIPPKIAYIREEIDPKTGIFKNPPEALDKVGDFTEWFIQSDFETLTIDDATALNKFAKNKAISSSPDFRSGAINSLTKSRKIGYPLMEVDDYNREMNMVEWFLEEHLPRIGDVNKNFILLAHEKYVFKDSNKIGAEPVLSKIRPAFTGRSFPDTIGGKFDFLWKADVVNGTKFRFITMPTGMSSAKTRWSGIFKETEDSMTFLQLMERMKST